MSVAISCNLSDGVILGVDSAVTLPGPGGILKVYENAEKLFQLGTKHIGVATYGLGGLRDRTIGSYLREFEILDPGQVIGRFPSKVPDIAEELRKFFADVYWKTIVPELEQATRKKFDELPMEERPVVGLVVGGFSDGEYLSEVWSVLIPVHSAPNSAVRVRGQGEFGTNWFAIFEPIRRYVKGFDPALLKELLDYFRNLRKQDFTQQEFDEMMRIVGKYEYLIPFQAMPIKEGVEHVRFLVEVVINHHRYATGAPVVGGKPRIGLVTYKAERFEIL